MNYWWFYRVENCVGYGPYFDREIEDWATGNHRDDPRRPAPESEGIKITEDTLGYIYGFESLDQMQAWFDATELSKLYKLGFKPVRVKGEPIVVTPHQVLFRPIWTDE